MFYHVGLGALVAAALVEASYENNLAYSSPSRRHPSLAVPLAHVSKRQTGDLFTPDELNFTHGVASGDPESDSVILWTRLAPTSENVASDLVPEGVVPIYDEREGARPSSKAACVEFKIATDSRFCKVVDQGRAYTTSDVDYTVKVRLRKLLCIEGKNSKAGNSLRPTT
jgi:alkaline phosphatase D